MEKEKVRCWELETKHGSTVDQLYITYPEGSLGHRLISCLDCGEIFAVNLTKELYVGPALEDKLKNLLCSNCGVKLSNSAHEYPDKYLGSDGIVYKYTRENEIPGDNTAVVREFIEIYSD